MAKPKGISRQLLLLICQGKTLKVLTMPRESTDGQHMSDCKIQKKPRNLTKEEYDDLVRKADATAATLFPLRRAARDLREDIGDAEDAISNLERDIQQYIDAVESRIQERVGKLNALQRRTRKKVAQMEADTKKRLKEIEVEKEETEAQRSQVLGKSEFLRVRLGEYEQCKYIESSQNEKIKELEEILAGVQDEHELVVQQLKRECTRDLRKMRRDYDRKMSLTNECAKRLARPCIVERIQHMRESNTELAHNMRRISQKQSVLFEKIRKMRQETNGLRYEYEMWKEVQRRKLRKCDPLLVTSARYSIEPIKTFDMALPEVAKTEVVQTDKLTSYQELKRMLRSLLRPDDTSTDSDEQGETDVQDKDLNEDADD